MKEFELDQYAAWVIWSTEAPLKRAHEVLRPRVHTCQHLKIKNLTLMCAKHTSRARSAKSLAAGVQGPLKGPGSSRVVEALWCYLALFFTIWPHWMSYTSMIKIMHILLNELLYKFIMYVCVCVYVCECVCVYLCIYLYMYINIWIIMGRAQGQCPFIWSSRGQGFLITRNGKRWQKFSLFLIQRIPISSAQTSRLFFEPGTDGIAPIGNRCPDIFI